MDEQNVWEQKLKRACKHDKIGIYRDIIKNQQQSKSPQIIDTYKAAVTIAKACLNSEGLLADNLNKAISEIYCLVFSALGTYAGSAYFSEVFKDFKSFEKQVTSLDDLAMIYSELNYLFWLQNKPDESIKYGLKSVEKLDKSGNINILAGRYANIGFVYESRGDYTNAARYYKKGLNFGFTIKSDKVISLAYCSYGRLNMLKGNFKSALNFFLEALKYFEDEKNDDYISLCSNIGAVYGNLGKYEESVRYFTRFINNETKANNPETYYSLLLNAANSYTNLGKFDQAEDYLLAVLEHGRKIDNLEYVSAALLNLGSLEIRRGNWSKALEYCLTSKKHIETTGNKQQELSVDINIGVSYLHLEETEKSLSFFKSALEIATKYNLQDDISTCYKNIAELYEKTGQYDLALDNYKLHYKYEMAIKDEKIDMDINNIKEHYRKKSVSPNRLMFATTHSLISRELTKQIQKPFIGTSHQIKKVLNQALIGAEHNCAPVLLTGDTGTGKEIVARIIHYSGARKNHPFISINCLSLPSTLIESTFFGSEKGAYTGADAKKIGYFEAVEHGTLFLDEIGDMPVMMQSKLLRVLEEHVIHRVGGTKSIPVDFRLITATNKNLYQLSETNAFRFDLLNRINTLEIYIPPLRERKEDIPLLIDYYLTLFCEQKDMEKPIISKAALDMLIDYNYPGNVRELKNILQRSVLLCSEPVLEPEDIAFPTTRPKYSTIPYLDSSNLNLAECEKNIILNAMQQAGNVQLKAARLLGISPYALSRKMKKIRAEQ